MIPVAAVLFLLLAMAAAGILSGWNLAIQHYKAERRDLFHRVEAAEQALAAFHRRSDEDPQRTWIDIGTRSAINRVETTLESLRNTLKD